MTSLEKAGFVFFLLGLALMLKLGPGEQDSTIGVLILGGVIFFIGSGNRREGH